MREARAPRLAASKRVNPTLHPANSETSTSPAVSSPNAATTNNQWPRTQLRHELLMEGTINGEPKALHDGDKAQAKEKEKGKEEIMSPESSSSNSHKPKLQLPLTVDPPGPTNPPKQPVWIVR